MAVADELDRARAALQMINPVPYNAEAPPEAMIGDITPVGLHYVRSNFALPAHDGTLEIGGAVENPLTLALDDLRSLPAHERAVTLECAGNGRLDRRRASPPPLTARRSAPAYTPWAARPGREPGPSRASTSASPAKATGTPPGSIRPKGRTGGRTGRSTGRRTTSAGTPSAPVRPTRPATRNRRSRPGTASATGTTRSRSCTSTCADAPRADGPVDRTPTPRDAGSLRGPA